MEQGLLSQERVVETSDWESKMEEMLRAPFDPEYVKWRVASIGKGQSDKVEVLAYLDARGVRERLNQIFGVSGWSTRYLPCNLGNDAGFICELSVRIGDEIIMKADGAQLTNFEAIKGGISDAFKRAAVCFGIGEYLYQLPRTFAEVSKENRNKEGAIYVREKSGWFVPPELPAWALPGGRRANGVAKAGGSQSKDTPVKAAASKVPGRVPQAKPAVKQDDGPEVSEGVPVGEGLSVTQLSRYRDVVGILEADDYVTADKYPYAYSLPYEKDGWDMGAIRGGLKKEGSAFRKNGKKGYWFTREAHEELSEYEAFSPEMVAAVENAETVEDDPFDGDDIPF